MTFLLFSNNIVDAQRKISKCTFTGTQCTCEVPGYKDIIKTLKGNSIPWMYTSHITLFSKPIELIE